MGERLEYERMTVIGQLEGQLRGSPKDGPAQRRWLTDGYSAQVEQYIACLEAPGDRSQSSPCSAGACA
jgi:hypothetical protein